MDGFGRLRGGSIAVFSSLSTDKGFIGSAVKKLNGQEIAELLGIALGKDLMRIVWFSKRVTLSATGR